MLAGPGSMAPRHERCQRGTPRVGVRTPIGRYGGALAGMRPHDLAAHVIGELTRRHRDVGWAIVDDVVGGWGERGGLGATIPPCVPPASTLGYGLRFCRRT